MIRVAFTQPTHAEWLEWVEEAKSSADKVSAVVQKGGKPKVNDRLYKKMREVFYEAFHKKCAYCERKFVLDQTGDIDHFRPKGAVTDEDGNLVLINRNGKKEPHPGYYWLAYDWRNLLPTCGRCNRVTKLANGQLVGKGTCFPVKDRAYAWQPGKEISEVPLFINPLFEDPEDDLELETETGVIFSKTRRGEICIEKLDLNREGLAEERRNRFTDVLGRMVNVFTGFQFGGGKQMNENLALIRKYTEGSAELSWAGRIAVKAGRKNLLAMDQAIGG